MGKRAGSKGKHHGFPVHAEPTLWSPLPCHTGDISPHNSSVSLLLPPPPTGRKDKDEGTAAARRTGHGSVELPLLHITLNNGKAFQSAN